MTLTAVPRQPASALSRDPDTAVQVTMATRRPVLVETVHGDREHAADVDVNTLYERCSVQICTDRERIPWHVRNFKLNL